MATNAPLHFPSTILPSLGKMTACIETACGLRRVLRFRVTEPTLKSGGEDLAFEVGRTTCIGCLEEL